MLEAGMVFLQWLLDPVGRARRTTRAHEADQTPEPIMP
jgi:hypothetical protein